MPLDNLITLETWKRIRKLNEPVTNVAEFQTYWAENYNVKVSDELAKLDFKAVQAAADGIELVLQLFPKTARMLTELNVDSTYLMSTDYEGRINFHPERFKHKGELEKTARADAESGFHPKNTGIYEEISQYAQQKTSECLAEAVADYVANGENAATLSKEIWKILKWELE